MSRRARTVFVLAQYAGSCSHCSGRIEVDRTYISKCLHPQCGHAPDKGWSCCTPEHTPYVLTGEAMTFFPSRFGGTPDNEPAAEPAQEQLPMRPTLVTPPPPALVVPPASTRIEAPPIPGLNHPQAGLLAELNVATDPHHFQYIFKNLVSSEVTPAERGLPPLDLAPYVEQATEGAYRVLQTNELSIELLRRNTRNRPVMPGVLAKWQNSMINKRWMHVGDSISLDWHEVMMNGQHRSLAQLITSIPMPIWIFTGLDPEGRQFQDKNAPKTPAQDLRAMGWKRATSSTSAMCRLLSDLLAGEMEQRNWVECFSKNADAMPAEQCSELLSQHPRLHDESLPWAQSARKKRQGVKASESVLGVAHYVITQIDPIAGGRFMHKLKTNAVLDSDPIRKARDLLENTTKDKTSVLALSFLFKAWNYHVTNQTPRLLSVRYNEAFPMPIGFDVLREPR